MKESDNVAVTVVDGKAWYLKENWTGITIDINRAEHGLSSDIARAINRSGMGCEWDFHILPVYFIQALKADVSG